MIRHGTCEYNDYTGYTLISGDLAIAKCQVMLELDKDKVDKDKLWNDIKYLEESRYKLDVDKNTVEFINNIILYLRDYVEYTAIDTDSRLDYDGSNINAAIHLSSDVLNYLQGDISRLHNTILGYTEPETTTHLCLNISNEDEESIIITVQNHIKHISIDSAKNDSIDIEDREDESE